MTGGRGLSATTVAARLAEAWDLTAATLTRHDGGMNSQTWFVEADRRRFVAKAVPSDRRASFRAGLAIATLVEAAGFRAGAPMPTRDGAASVEVDGHELALLRFVEGSELIGESAEERVLIGSTLGRVHLALAGQDALGFARFHWLDATASHLSVRPWVRPAVEAAIAAWQSIPPESLTWGLLHTDPATEAFRLDPTTGDCGLIDWDLGLVGPLLYDLASAEMYVGGAEHGRPLVDAYLATGALRQDEVDRALRPMARMRQAVQADYFAKRIATNDLTGIEGSAGNEKGLEDARQGLARES